MLEQPVGVLAIAPVGRPTRRLDAPDKVLGRTTYGIDVRLPGMLNAALVQCPVFKGTLKSVDDSKARGMPGVRTIVALKDAVAVVADTFWHAQQAAKALAITWDDGHNGSVSSNSIADFVRSGLEAHEAAAVVALIAVETLGVLALAALLLFRKRVLPRPLVGAALVFALVTAGWMAQTANLGGRIRHAELRATATQTQDNHEDENHGREGR